jgi:hypothetical protein
MIFLESGGADFCSNTFVEGSSTIAIDTESENPDFLA